MQGAGAALVTPTSLALIREAYQDPGQRARAIAYWAMGGSVAAAAGPVLGSLGVAAFGAVATQASFLHGLHVSYLTAAVLLAITAAASTTLRRVTR